MPFRFFRPEFFQALFPFRPFSRGIMASSVFFASFALNFVPACAAIPGAILVPGEISDSSRPRVQDPVAALSGSPYPGVIDHLLQRPLEGQSESQASIHISYPSIGNKIVDADIRNWVGEIADAFESHMDLAQIDAASPSLDDQINAFLQDDDLNYDVAQERDRQPLELFGSYKVSRPSDAAVSITFELWNYAGGGQGNLDIITMNYNLLNSRRLNFVDIFEKPDVALQLMSSWSRKMLAPRLAHAGGEQVLNNGTFPLVENFSSLTLTPEGICINFQPFQVAPGSAGIQKVEMPLAELMPSAPLLALWGK